MAAIGSTDLLTKYGWQAPTPEPNEGNDTDAIVEGDVNTGMSIFQMLMLYGQNEKGAAEQEVKANETEVNNINESANTTANNTRQEAEPLIAQLEANQQKVQEKIDLMSEQEEKKKEYQDRLEKSKSTVENCKNIINNSNSTSAERLVAIEKLRAEGENINLLSGEVEAVGSDIVTISDEADAINSDSTDINNEVSVVITNGNSALNAIMGNLTQATVKNNAVAATGAVNETTSVAANAASQALRASASALSINPFSNAAAQKALEEANKLMQVSTDQGGAGSARIPGSALALGIVETCIGVANSSLADFSNIGNTAVGSFGNVSSLLNNLNPLINSIGGWFDESSDKLSGGSEELAQATEEVAPQIEEDDNNADGDDSVKPQDGVDTPSADNGGKDDKTLLFNPDLKFLDDVLSA